MFSAALLLESALGFDCPNPEFDEERPLTETLQLTCARDSTAIFRTTFLAGSKAVRAAGHCGGTDTLCGRSILRSAAALSGVGETGVFLRVFCHGATPCCQKNPDTDEIECECEPKDIIENKRDDKDDQKQCARFGGSTVKLLGSAALAATEAEGQCKFSKTAESTCQTTVPVARLVLQEHTAYQDSARWFWSVCVFFCGHLSKHLTRFLTVDGIHFTSFNFSPC